MVRDDRLNVLIHHYGDLDLLRGAVDSVPDNLPIHVVDGRFEAFKPGDPPLTPGTAAFCRDRENVHYHAPNLDRLPFGVEFDGVANDLRPGVHAKARYSYYEVLPEDEWAFQIDTDERVLDLDLSVLSDLDPEKRYQPTIEWDEGDRGFTSPMVVPRVTVPKYWTLWIDDAGIPRSEVSRDMDLPTVRRLYVEYRDEGDYEFLPEFRLRNLGPDARPREYNLDRSRHLKRMGRYGRAEQVQKETLDSGKRDLNPG